jgi:predicted GNAT family N-acyltransferase
VGRMAVDRTVRGGRLGRDVLQALMEAARERGDAEVVLHAQRSAEGFYARLGYSVLGEPFEEAGIPHVTMFKRL